MRRIIIPLFIFAAAGLVLSITGIFRVTNRQEPQQRMVVQPDVASIGLHIPEFSLTDQDNRPRTQTMLDGRVTVMDFFFTHCPFICPMMTLSMEDVSKELRGLPVQFVSISVDPAHDPPARLRDFATNRELDLTRWTFLTGDFSTVERIVRDSLGFALGRDSDPKKEIPLPDGTTMQNVIHPGKLVLIGPDRKVLGFYEYSDPDACRVLVNKARAAVKLLK